MKDPGWTSSQRSLVVKMLRGVKHVFQQNELDHEFVKGHRVGINTGNVRPIVMPSYKYRASKIRGRKEVGKRIFNYEDN